MCKTKILIADDSAGIRMLLEFYLQQTDMYEVLIASDGQEAVDIALAQSPALILMDMQMPVLDGFDACKRLRQEHGKDATVLPIIALSGSDTQSDLDRATEIGCNGFLSKPVEMERVLSIIAETLQIENSVK